MKIETKYCNKCSSTKGASSFGKCSRNNDGLQSWCKECKKNNYQSKHLGLGKYSQVSYDVLSTMSEKFCWSCMTMKSRSDYSVDSSRKDGMQVKCKECCAEIAPNYYENARLAYLEKNKDKPKPIRLSKEERDRRDKEHKRNHYLKNKDRIHLEKRLKYKNDKLFRIVHNQRCRTNQVLKGITKSSSQNDLLGCNRSELRNHLELSFKKGMNWENYGKVWEVDHIRPCDTFDLTKKSDQRKCFHYSNLQALFITTDIARQYGFINEVGNRNKKNKLI